VATAGQAAQIEHVDGACARGVGRALVAKGVERLVHGRVGVCRFERGGGGDDGVACGRRAGGGELPPRERGGLR